MNRLCFAVLFFLSLNVNAMSGKELIELNEKEKVLYILGVTEGSLLTTEIANVHRVFCPKKNNTFIDVIAPIIDYLNQLKANDPKGILKERADILILSTLDNYNKCDIRYQRK